MEPQVNDRIEKIAGALEPEFVAEFWNFVYERHEIYRRRFLEGRPAPWTEDPILQSVFFTNVYRELDRGTEYYLTRVVDQKAPIEDSFFETLVYRQFNNVRTYEFMKNFRRYGDWQNWQKIAAELSAYGARERTNIFTDAHMTTGVKWGGFPDKPRNVCWMLYDHWCHRHGLTRAVMEAESLRERHRMIASLQGYGPFLAYEVVTDLGYFPSLNPKGFTEDDWANPGPGCRRAIDLMLPPSAQRVLGIGYEEIISALRVLQRDYFQVLELDFHYLEGRELSLRNIEHSLCEYYKYSRAKREGRARRKYRKTLTA